MTTEPTDNESESAPKCTECSQPYETEGHDLRCLNCGCHQDVRE